MEKLPLIIQRLTVYLQYACISITITLTIVYNYNNNKNNSNHDDNYDDNIWQIYTAEIIFFKRALNITLPPDILNAPHP